MKKCSLIGYGYTLRCVVFLLVCRVLCAKVIGATSSEGYLVYYGVNCDTQGRQKWVTQGHRPYRHSFSRSHTTSYRLIVAIISISKLARFFHTCLSAIWHLRLDDPDWVSARHLLLENSNDNVTSFDDTFSCLTGLTRMTDRRTDGQIDSRYN